MKTATINTIEEALREAGVTDKTLTSAEKKALDEQGYLVLTETIDRKWLKDLRDIFEQLSEQERETGGHQTKQETGTRHLNLKDNADKNVIFEGIYTNPKLLAAVYHVLKRDFRLFGLGGRDPLPGFGQQGLHSDWMPRNYNDPFQVVNSIWMLDDFTPDSGPTRIVPGSHLFIGKPDKKVLAPTAVHPKQIFVTAPAGSVLIFNAHLWHSGTVNKSKNHRRVIDALFAARENVPFSEPPSGDFEQLSPVARYLLNL